jgi:hypothetical protein
VPAGWHAFALFAKVGTHAACVEILIFASPHRLIPGVGNRAGDLDTKKLARVGNEKLQLPTSPTPPLPEP